MSLNHLLLVGAGGFLGSICRYSLSGWLLKPWSLTFPLGTLAVNVLGSLMIGYVFGFIESRPITGETLRGLVVVGFLGGFTTFSAFSLETFGLLQDGQWAKAGLNAGLSVILCLLAVALGFGLAHWIHQAKAI